MTRISKILVPLDFSKAAQKAMYYATHLALRFSAKLTAAHIVPSFAAFNYSFPADMSEFEERSLNEVRKKLPEEIPAEYREQLNTETILKSGDVRDELLGIITGGAGEKVDLVVMGTHGRRSVINLHSKGFFERALRGATAERVIRSASIPVLSIPMDAAAELAPEKVA